jgi:DNA-3-methyladenine glycosylase
MNSSEYETPPSGKPLSPPSFMRDPDVVARDLLGTILFRRFPDGSVAAGRIIETEAYSQDDPASHSYPGLTRRNSPMFGSGGTAYVYLIYGIHHCFNVVTGPEGEGSAVLIRGILPIIGAERMRKKRGNRIPDRSLCDGPGKICQALELDRGWNNHPLREPPLQLLSDGASAAEKHVLITPRIGITKNAGELRRYVWDYEKQNFS